MKVVKNLSFAVLIGLAHTAANAHPTTALTRNQTNIVGQTNWFERLSFSGLFMGEVIYSNRNQCPVTRFNSHRSYSTFCFPRANLYVDATLNEWVKAHMGFRFVGSCGFGSKNDEQRFFRFGERIDDSYITISNPARTNAWGRLGIQHLPYGDFERNMIPATLPQLLTQSQVGGLQFGYHLPHHFEVTGFVFSGKKKFNGTEKILNGGAQIGWHTSDDISDLHWTLDWMYNIAGGVNYIVHMGRDNPKNPLYSGYRRAVGGIHTGLKGHLCNWDGKLQYTTALQKFNDQDLLWQGQGAKPAAWLAELGYTLHVLPERPIRLNVNYQHSYQSVNVRGPNLGLPKSRIQGGVMVDVFPELQTGVQVVHDKDYATSKGGTGLSSTTALLMVKAYLV